MNCSFLFHLRIFFKLNHTFKIMIHWHNNFVTISIKLTEWWIFTIYKQYSWIIWMSLLPCMLFSNICTYACILLTASSSCPPFAAKIWPKQLLAVTWHKTTLISFPSLGFCEQLLTHGGTLHVVSRLQVFVATWTCMWRTRWTSWVVPSLWSTMLWMSVGKSASPWVRKVSSKSALSTVLLQQR